MQHTSDEDDQQTKNMAHIIFESALLESGYSLAKPKEFNQRIYDILAQSLKTKADFSKGSDFAEVSSQSRKSHGYPPSFRAFLMLHLEMLS